MSSKNYYLDLIDRLGGGKVAVIGDIMLDRSLFGVTERFSAEAPIPIVDVKSKVEQLGGAANVANNLRALGNIPTLFSVVGDDQDGGILSNLIEDNIPGEHFIFQESGRPTTVKMRTFAQDRQIARADFESCREIKKEAVEKLVTGLNNRAHDLSAIVVEDYNKGLLTASFIKEILKIAKKFDLKILVDPKFDNFFEYEGVTLFKPNIKELSEATSIKISNVEQVKEAASILRKKLKSQYVMVTMGKDGIFLMGEDERSVTRPAFVRIVNDPAGAGDTVISVMTSALVAGISPEDAMVIANYGGGAICERVGIQPITLQDLMDAIRRNEKN
ncbi:MAG: bifunctional ADP-heptose synthase [Pseudomonadota bacterium]|nr:bifunctional ADP-heptose synthase [Pseudomonadota bacterium]